MEELLIRYVHFLGLMLLSSTLFAEHLLIAGEMESKQFKKLVAIDAIYGISALVVFIAGLSLWFFVGKPSTFYSSNWIFHTKVAFFAIIFVLSLFPTVFILRHRNFDEAIVKVPKYIINIIRVEILLVVCIPLMAVTMARGFGAG